MQGRFIDSARSDSVGYANSSGWMQQSDFVKSMKHFIRHAHARKGLLIFSLLDNRVSHLSIEVFDLAIAHDITIVSFPPRCSNKMQPMDCGVFHPIKALYESKYAAWMKSRIL